MRGQGKRHSREPLWQLCKEGARSGALRLREGTLGIKMAALSICVALVACLSLAILAYLQAAAGLRSQEQAVLSTDAQLTTSAIQRWHAQQFGSLEMIARLPAVQRVLENGAAASAADRETAQVTLDALAAVSPELESVGLMDTSGTSLQDSDISTVGVHLPNRDYFVDSMKGNRFVSDLDISVITNQPAIFHSVPVKNSSGRVVGVARSRASLKAIEAVVQAASSQDAVGGLGILIDDDGLVILNSHDPSWLLRPILPLEPSREAALIKSLKWGSGGAPPALNIPDLAQAPGLQSRLTFSMAIDGTRYDALAVPISDSPWAYVTLRPLAPFDALAHDSIRNGLAVSVAAALTVLLIGYRIRRGVYRDALTGLPNRELLLERLSSALGLDRPEDARVAVLLVDLDRFNVINDSLGYAAGDELLVAVSARLKTRLGSAHMIARVGGDEFAVLVVNLEAQAYAIGIAERVLTALEDPIDLGGRSLYVAASIGIAVSTGVNAKPDQLLREVDLALYRAKGAGRGRYAAFEPHMESGALERLDIEMGLREALERGELRVHYQPIISLSTGRVTEVEALVRWAHPTRGLIAPSEFIPIAEETGLIVPLGYFVLQEAAQQVRTWQRLYRSHPPLVVAVNLSGRQLAHPGLIKDIESALTAADLDPRFLKLEITESVVMQDAEATISTLRQLKMMGIQLAIDDFGTGYSSLSYLKRFPIDTLKIDRSFVAGVGEDAQDTAIVRSVVALAQALGLTVTSEGIETAAQESYLRELGCEYGQGYLFARPKAAEHIGPLLRERNYAPRHKWAA